MLSGERPLPRLSVDDVFHPLAAPPGAAGGLFFCALPDTLADMEANIACAAEAIEVVPIDELQPDPANVRAHDDANLQAISRSLERFGQQKPLVVGPGNRIVAGNGTWQAAKRLDWDEIAITRSLLDGAEAQAFAVADNRTTDLSAFDEAALAEVLEQIREDDAELLAATGYAEDELQELLAASETAPGADVDPDVAGQSDATGGLTGAPETVTIQISEVRPEDVGDLLERITEAIDGSGYLAEAI